MVVPKDLIHALSNKIMKENYYGVENMQEAATSSVQALYKSYSSVQAATEAFVERRVMSSKRLILLSKWWTAELDWTYSTIVFICLQPPSIPVLSSEHHRAEITYSGWDGCSNDQSKGKQHPKGNLSDRCEQQEERKPGVAEEEERQWQPQAAVSASLTECNIPLPGKSIHH